MKKTRLLIATLVCAVMLMGVGYAWWTDSVAIGGTAVTGNMDVNFAEEVTVANSDYVVVEASASGKTATCGFSNLYPNAMAGFSGTIENNSSIPVKLVDATLTFNPENAALKPFLLASMTQNGEYVGIDEFVANFVANFNANLTNGQIAAGATTPVSVFVKIDEEAGNDTTEGQTIGFNLTLDWQQFNQ